MHKRWATRIGPMIISLVLGVMVPIPNAFGVEIDDHLAFGDPEPWSGPTLVPGDRGPWVTELQSALSEAGFRVEDEPGRFGRGTVTAVRTFQRVHDLPFDAVFAESYWSILRGGTAPPGPGGEGSRIEIDIARQLLWLIEEGQLKVVVAVSTANGGQYLDFWGRVATARTPEGRFAIYNQRAGWHESYLGYLYRPFYFNGGYAIHGSTDVPWQPASHGCVRVRIADMNFLAGELKMGIPVYVYGRRVSRDEVVPRPAPPVEVGRLMALAVRATV